MSFCVYPCYNPSHTSHLSYSSYATMSLTRQIAHNTIIQIAGKIISTLLGFVAFGMMTRFLPTEQFGWYITVISFLQFIGIFTDFGLTPVTAQMLSEPNCDKKQLFRNLLGFRFATALIFFGLAPLIALFFPYPREIKIAVSFTSLSFLAIAMNQILVGLYQTKLKMYIPVLGEIIGRLALVSGLFLVIRLGWGFLPIMGIVTASSIVYTLVIFVLSVRSVPETPLGLSFHWPIWRAIAAKMWPIAVSIMFNVVYLKGDVVLLSLFSAQTNVALYGAAYRVLDVITQSAMMLMGVLLPLLAYSWSRGEKEEFKKRYQQAFDAMMVFAVPVTVGAMALSGPVMTLVAGNKYTDSGAILAILAIAVFGVYLGAVFGHAAVAINKQKQTMWIYISDAVLTLIGYLIFIPRFGIWGAAWMSVFSELYAGILLALTIRHYTKERLQLKTLGKIILASGAMAAVLWPLRDQNIFATIPLAIAVFGITLLAIRGVSTATLREIIARS